MAEILTYSGQGTEYTHFTSIPGDSDAACLQPTLRKQSMHSGLIFLPRGGRPSVVIWGGGNLSYWFLESC